MKQEKSPHRRRGGDAGVYLIAGVSVLMIWMAAQAPATAATPVIRSSGCEAARPTTAPSAVSVGGAQRPLLVIAEKNESNKPLDLVISFHGRTNSNVDARAYYDLERHAVRPTVFVYPTGLPTGGGGRSWNSPGDPAGQLRDYELFDIIVLRLARLYCIDLGRVFAVGHSLGASFVNNLACARGGSLRGIATVAGDIGAAGCNGPVAALLFHSPRDEVVSITRGEAVRDRLLAVNNLRGRPEPLPSGDLNCVRHGAADALFPVVWCAHGRTTTRRGNYYPHQWPREAGMLIMAFFASLP
jgi:polyhydroxybutyrate depolymerase